MTISRRMPLMSLKSATTPKPFLHKARPMRDEYCFLLSSGGYPITFALTALYGSSYGICLNAAKSWFERSIEDGLAFRDKLLTRGSPAPELGAIGSSPFVCQVKKGVVRSEMRVLGQECV